MAWADIGGAGGVYLPPIWGHQLGASGVPAYRTTLQMTASGHKAAMVGRVSVPGGGTKNLTKIHFRFGAVTKGGSTDIRVSVQAVNATDAFPDGSVIQSGLVGNANITANSAANATLGSVHSTANGALLSIVWDYSTFTAADDIVIASMQAGSATQALGIPYSALYTASWATTAYATPLVVLEFDDGTFGSFAGAHGHLSGINSHAFNNTSNPDEYAIRVTPNAPIRACGLWILADMDGNCDFVMYSGSTAMTGGTISADKDNRFDGVARYLFLRFGTRLELSAGTDYYLAVKPTSATTVTVYSLDYAAAGHLQADVGTEIGYATRDGYSGAFSDTDTRRLVAGLIFDGIDDGIRSRMTAGMQA